MDFELTEDQQALREGARQVLDSACPLSLARAVHEGSAAPLDELWSTLASLDWPGIGIPEELGGLGLGFVEVGVVVEELGRAVAPTPFLATVTQLVPVLREAGATTRLTDVAQGRLTGTLAVAEHGRWWSADIRATAQPHGTSWVLQGEKTHVFDGATADELAIVARQPGTGGEDGLGVFLVPRAAATVEPTSAMDPTLPLATVGLDGVEVPPERVLLEPGDPAAAAAVRRSLEEATAALALSTTATCRRIFEMTLQHAKDREQFGRPIGSFQALKHRLADLYLAVERASALAWFAALTIAEDDGRRSVACSMAKAAAGECQRLVVADGLQLHGGIGFTWEHDLHLLLKRAKTGDLLLGTAAEHRAHLARLLGVEAA